MGAVSPERVEAHMFFAKSVGWLRLILFLSCVGPLTTNPSLGNDFYANKKIDIIVGSDAGGGYDSYSRLLARYMRSNIQGAPQFVIKYMPGAGSAVAASFITNIAPQDGTVIAALQPGAVMGKLIDEKASDLFDPTKLNYLGTMNRASRLCITSSQSNIKTIDDALAKQTIMGASGGGSLDYAALHNNAIKTKFKIIAGYRGTNDLYLAMERGEIDGLCGTSLASLGTIRPHWIAERKINIILYDSLSKDDLLEKLGVPHVMNYIHNQVDRNAVELYLSQQDFNRPYAVGPNVPRDNIAILRSAFSAALKDDDLRKEAAQLNIDISLAPGDLVQANVIKVHGFDASIIKRAKEIIQVP